MIITELINGGADDPNFPPLKEYNDAPDVSKSDANPAITKDVVDQINSNFEKLEKQYQ